jgi:hypothetical protein
MLSEIGRLRKTNIAFSLMLNLDLKKNITMNGRGRLVGVEPAGGGGD